MICDGFVATVPHLPKCMSYCKVIAVITGRAHCFHDYIIYTRHYKYPIFTINSYETNIPEPLVAKTTSYLRYRLLFCTSISLVVSECFVLSVTFFPGLWCKKKNFLTLHVYSSDPIYPIDVKS